MVYNNVTNTLRNWCNKMTQQYSAEYELERANTGQSIRFLSYLVTAELSYKLGTLIDKDFSSYTAYRNAVLALLPQHVDYILKKELDRAETGYVRSAESAFCEYLDSISPDCASPIMPYNRIIRGAEASAIAKQFNDKWGYDTSYWYPLNTMSGNDKLFISSERLEPYLTEICQLLGLPKEHIYEYGEAWYDCPHCAEIEALEDYAGCEKAYCPKDFSWIIYCSHENTITFAGTIVPKIKEILHAEQEHWNRFEHSD